MVNLDGKTYEELVEFRDKLIEERETVKVETEDMGSFFFAERDIVGEVLQALNEKIGQIEFLKGTVDLANKKKKRATKKRM